MIKALPYKSKQFLFLCIKLGLVVAAFYFIYDKLLNNPDLEFHVLKQNLTKSGIFSLKNLIFLLILTFSNWFFEILKWKTLVSSIKFIAFKYALEQSLGALTASMMTPNRIGEYGAKAIYYEKALRKKIMLLNLIGNMMQMTTTVIFGIVGFLFFASNFQVELNYHKLFTYILISTLVFGFILFILKKRRFEIKGFSLRNIFKFAKDIPLNIKLKAFLFSIIRYLIFSFQFFYLLLVFGVPLHYFEAMMVITSMYLLSSIVPSLFLFDVVIKGSVAIVLFSFVGVNDLMVLCVVTMMWLLNFVLPSMFGSYYVINFTLPKELDTA